MSNTWLGDTAAFEAPQYEEIYEGGAKRATATFHGLYSALQGAVVEPNGVAKVPGTTDCVLTRCKLTRQEGDSGVLVFEGTAADSAVEPATATTPKTTRIRLTWTPRQVPIERGRINQIGSTYDYALLEYWKRTEDFNLKKAYKAVVPVLYGTGAALNTHQPADSVYAAATVEIHELDADTKAIAERIAIGMETYEDYYPVVTIKKTWYGKAPSGALVKPGTQGDPPSMPPGIDLSDYYWICCAGDVEQPAANDWVTTNAWTGLLSGAIPEPKPTGWGSTPFDDKYYSETAP